MVGEGTGQGGDISEAELFELRVIAHGWAVVDEVTFIGAPEMARKVLRVLDAVATLTGTTAKAAEWDAMLRKVHEHGG